jgi:hypothetical protein
MLAFFSATWYCKRKKCFLVCGIIKKNYLCSVITIDFYNLT